VRVFATDSQGNILGLASDGAVLGYADFSNAACGL
jgi:hypothetical protein